MLVVRIAVLFSLVSLTSGQAVMTSVTLSMVVLTVGNVAAAAAAAVQYPTAGSFRRLSEDLHHDEEEMVVSGTKPWGEAIGSAVLVNLATLTGLLFVFGGCLFRRWTDKLKANSRDQVVSQLTNNVIPMFAAGALLATTVFLIVPEGLAMLNGYQVEKATTAHTEEPTHHKEDESERWLQEDHHEEDEEVDVETQVAWRFGVCILAGFLIPLLSSFVFSHEELTVEEIVDSNVEEGDDQKTGVGSNEHTTPVDACGGGDDDDMVCELCHDSPDKDIDEQPDGSLVVENPPVSFENKRPPINWPFASAILIGDFFHNFTDGILIGTAWLLCTRDLAWAISAATIYHELAQEIADYLLLTKHCHMAAWMALTLNFVSGFSVVCGVVLIFALDINQNATGCILTIGAGVYLHVACASCVPQALAHQKVWKEKATGVLAFVLGAIPIGMVLLNHGHCEAGHNH